MKRWKRQILKRHIQKATGIIALLFLIYNTQQQPRDNATLFIAIGTKPTNFALRAALRRTWLTWVAADPTVRYRFFTETGENSATDIRLRMEAREHGDVELQELRGGYRAFAARGLFQMRWAMTRYVQLSHYLRVDDDTFLCYRKLRWELAQRPQRRFFWGKYFCRAGKHCADENFMLFSIDIVRDVLRGVDAGALPVRWNNTLARNFGLWSRRWPQLVVFDDRERFDVQQGLLTEYMHEKVAARTDGEYRQFCERYLFAHWVKSSRVMDNVFRVTGATSNFSLPRITSNVEGCPDAGLRTLNAL